MTTTSEGARPAGGLRAAMMRLALLAVAAMSLGSNCGNTCPNAGATPCPTNACADLNDDAFNCGACGRACPTGQRCLRGVCALCPAGQTACVSGGVNRCVDAQTDSQNCGACAHACRTGEEACRAGVCVRTAPCTAPFSMCGTDCPNLQNNARHCGACGRACDAGEVCAGGACACDAGQTRCGGRCTRTDADPAHCGACGRACGAGESCVMGVCAAPCVAPGTVVCVRAGAVTCPAFLTLPADCGGCTNLTPCNGFCRDTRSDNFNCGACGRACSAPAGETCVNGVCAVCPTGRTRCLQSNWYACVDTGANPFHCGACGRRCGVGEACAGGLCAAAARCPSGQADCTPGAPSPTCVDTSTSAAHCGVCGRACDAGLTCVGGVCQRTCPAGQVVCGTGAASRCVDTLTDRANCGECGHRCASGAACDRGSCQCPAGQTVCGGGCFDTSTDMFNCGGCAVLCLGVGYRCVAGVCTSAPTCAPGESACAVGGAVTCRNLQTDAAHCGACGRPCAAGQTCAAGVCSGGAATCPSGQTTCAGRCVNLYTDRSNCGACGRVCPSSQVCATGACRATCAMPLTLCGNAEVGGCVNTAVDVRYCGSCTTACAAGRICARASGTSPPACVAASTDETCSPSAPLSCAGRCVNHLSDRANCGGCGIACATSQSCVNGLCVLLG